MIKKDKSIFFIQIICSLLIVNYHSSILNIPYLESIARGGFVLNTIFVFLSGYLLSVSFSNSKQNNFLSFMKKRIQRIYPAFFLVLLITLIYSLITAKEVILVNYLKWFSGFGYFFSNNEIFSNNHLWFVSVILVCYILFIPSFKLIQKWPILFLTFIISTILLYNYFWSKDAYLIYNNISGDVILRFLYHYFIFVLAIYRQQKKKSFKNFTYRHLITFVTCFIGYVLLKGNSTYNIIALLLVIPTALSLVPIFYKLSTQVQNKIPGIFKLSSIPYELYLIHFLVINSLDEYLHGNILSYPLTFIISISLAFLISKLSSKTMELFKTKNKVPSVMPVDIKVRSTK